MNTNFKPDNKTGSGTSFLYAFVAQDQIQGQGQGQGQGKGKGQSEGQGQNQGQKSYFAEIFLLRVHFPRALLVAVSAVLKWVDTAFNFMVFLMLPFLLESGPSRIASLSFSFSLSRMKFRGFPGPGSTIKPFRKLVAYFAMVDLPKLYKFAISVVDNKASSAFSPSHSFSSIF